MADGLCCIICTEAFFSPHTPMVLPCGHTVCKVCIDNMIKINHKVMCLSCRFSTGSMEVINELKENYMIKETLSGLEMKCWEHNKAALWVCVTECKPLCELCPEHFACDKKHILEQRGDLEFDLVTMVRDLLKTVQVNQDLASKAARVANAPLKEKVSVCKQLLRNSCANAWDPQMDFIIRARADFASIDSYLLTPELLSMLYHTPATLEECERLAERIHALVNVRATDYSDIPEYIYCLRCGTVFPKNQSMRILPCHNVRHLVCEACAQTMVAEGIVSCELDNKVFTVDDLTRLPVFMLQPNVKDGNTIAKFNPKDQSLSCVNLFRHVQPHISLSPEQRRDLNQEYTFFPASGQVEAITFTCQTDAIICGIGLTNPVQDGEALTIEWVKCYAGTMGIGVPLLATTTIPQVLLGWQATITDIRFVAPFPVPARSVHTIKLQLSRAAGGPVAMYCGNRLTRPGYAGTDGIVWGFQRTDGVDSTESCIGQHFLAGPIVRLIYRTNT